MGSGTSGIFAGNSRYASDFQAVIDRAVAIASMPKSQMETEKARIDAQAEAMRALNSAFGGVESALASMETALGPGSFTSRVSDGAVAKASLSGSALPGSYTIEVTALGSCTTALGADPNGTWLRSVADPAKQSFSSLDAFTLTISGSARYAISGGTLNEVAASINASGAPVLASIVNVGPPASPDYRLSLEATHLGPVEIALSGDDSGTERQFVARVGAAGALAAYVVQGKAVSADTRTVTVAPGLSVELLREGTATVEVERSTSALSGALGAFASAYNIALDAIDKHRGESAGVLSGSAILGTLSRALAGIAGYAPGSGPYSVLSEIGLELGKDGRLTLNSGAFSKAAKGRLDELSGFLGSAHAGGFLKAAADTLSGIRDEETGILGTEIGSLESRSELQGKRIEDEIARIDTLSQRLAAQMSAADALIAMLEQQVTYFSGMFESMRAASEGYR